MGVYLSFKEALILFSLVPQLCVLLVFCHVFFRVTLVKIGIGTIGASRQSRFLGLARDLFLEEVCNFIVYFKL